MWIARIWYLLLLLAAAVGFAGVAELPGFRDARVIEVADRAATLEAELIRNAVAASRDAARHAAHLAARTPRLQAALVESDPPLPPEARQSVLTQALAGAQTPNRQLIITDAQGAMLAASKGVDGAKLVQDPAIKRAIAGTASVRLRGDRWMAAVPLPKPARGALIALSPGPADAAVRAHAQAQPSTAPSTLVVLLDDAPVAGAPEAATREALVKAARPDSPEPITLSDARLRTRKYAVSSAPGMHLLLAWPVDAPTRFKDTGGPIAALTRGLQAMPEVAIFAGLAVLLWLVGVIIGNLRRAAVVRQVGAQIDLIAAGPELEPIELGDVPAWTRPVADAANQSAAAARQRMQSVMQARLDQLALAPSEVSAERPLDEPLPPDSSAPKSRPVARSDAPRPQDRASASQSGPDSSAPPPPTAPQGFDEVPTMQDVGLPSLPPPVGPPPDLDDSQDGPTMNRRASSAPPSRSPFAESQPPDGAGSAEGTTELPARRMGVFKNMPATSNPPAHLPPMSSAPPADPPPPTYADETIDRRGHGLSSAPPPAIEDAELSTDESGVWDMSLPGVSAEPTSTIDSIELPRPTAGSLLDQLRAKNALEPQSRGGDRTVVRPIPMALLDASTNNDSDRTAVGPAPTAPEGRDALERYYEQVFQEFLEIKRTCGEPTGGVQYRGFRAKLVRTRKSLMERFNCVDVRFRVYVKDGRAALKAAPILDEQA